MAKICAIKVEEGVVEMEEIEKEILIDNSLEEYMNEIKEAVKTARKSFIKLNKCESENKCNSVYVDSQSPIYQAVKLTPMSELNYII